MTLVIRDDKLIIGSDGKLTENDECCCDPPVPGDCECLNTTPDPDEIYSLTDIEVTVSGSSAPRPFDNHAGNTCSAPASCASMAGVYVVPCGLWRATGSGSTNTNWAFLGGVSTYVCDVVLSGDPTTYEVHYINWAVARYRFDGFQQYFGFGIWSSFVYTVVGGTPNFPVVGADSKVNAQNFRMYDLSGSCPPVLGVPTISTVPATENVCDPSGLSISVAFS